MPEGNSPKGLRAALAKARRNQPGWFVSGVRAELEGRGMKNPFIRVAAAETAYPTCRSTALRTGIWNNYCPNDHYTRETRPVILDGTKTEIPYCTECEVFFKPYVPNY